jgi:O-antigen/teichoic acid export membrane protein
MSTLSRIISGTAASWTRLAIGLLTQLFLVPLFLSHWNASTYGSWIGTFALTGLFQFVDVGHHNYIGFEALRLGANARSEIARLHRSAVRVAHLLSLAALALITLLAFFDAPSRLVGSHAGERSFEVGMLLLMPAVTWLLFGNWCSVAGRVLLPFGYFAPIAWWQVAGAIVTAVASAFALRAGGGLLKVGVAYHVTYALYSLVCARYLRRWIVRERLHLADVDYAFGFGNLVRSLAISVKSVLEMFRQEQIRILIAPFVGAASLVLFVTTRTVANVLITGLATITNPVLPELLRYLSNNDAIKTTAIMTVLWMIVVGGLVPAAAGAQLFIEPAFIYWTRGKVPFDAGLFALFSMGVIVFAFSRPPMAVVQGLNILRPQLVASFIATAIAVVGAAASATSVGIKAAAFALLLGEVVVAVIALLVMRKEFASRGIAWPARQLTIVIMAIVLPTLMTGLAASLQVSRILVLVACVSCAIIASLMLIYSLPPALRALVRRSIFRSPA